MGDIAFSISKWAFPEVEAKEMHSQLFEQMRLKKCPKTTFLIIRRLEVKKSCC